MTDDGRLDDLDAVVQGFRTRLNPKLRRRVGSKRALTWDYVI
jgi:hypothetical protein